MPTDVNPMPSDVKPNPKGQAPPKARSASLTFGWLSLLCWGSAGLCLEALHAFKVDWFFADDLTRMLLRLAHAHGGLCALVVLAHHATALHLSSGKLLRAGSLLLPLGFLLGAIAHPEGDPSLGILLAPIGALLVGAGLLRVVLAIRRMPPG